MNETFFDSTPSFFLSFILFSVFFLSHMNYLNMHTQSLLQSVKLFCDLGHFERAANIYINIAKLYEEEERFAEAVECYQHACDFYISEKMSGPAELGLQKVSVRHSVRK